MSEKEISRAVIRRLPRYFRFLGELRDAGVEKISSHDLSLIMHVTASQIRQDLNNFGGFGQQGYGYNVKYLYDEIGKILGLDQEHNVIIIGAGNLGSALAGYGNFANRGFIVKGAFDVNPALVGQYIRNVPIMPMSELPDFIEKNNIDIAVIAIPKAQAVGAAATLVSCGIKAIWNFSHVDLEVPDDVIVESVHLSESLMRLSYNLNRVQEGEEPDTGN
ncbi:MAG: redox-sensing transcriptional repressor Rex [Lachnospiraceae bacterium]|nr:redox-sensing transcriptional repressor Rex [Lachnospiraceae bacterium]